MTLKELGKRTGLRVQLIWSVNNGSADIPTTQPRRNWDHFYEARLDFSQSHNDRHCFKHIIVVGPRGGVRNPEARGWTIKEAKEKLVKTLRGKKIVSLNRSSGWQKIVVRIPKTLTA
jgi:hypothetical protein